MAIKAFSLSDIRNPSTSLGSEFTCDLSGTQFAAASRSNLTPVLFGSFIDFVWHFFCARLSAGPGWLAVEGLDSPSRSPSNVAMVSSSANSLTLSASMNEYQGENREERLSRGIEVKLNLNA